MTCYLTDGADPAELVRGKEEGVWVAAKLYPAHATTNSAHGVTSMDRVAKGLEAMEKAGMPLLVHGEVTDPEVDIFDREAVFLDKVLAPLLKRHPGLKIVLEHITTREGVAFVEAQSRPASAARSRRIISATTAMRSSRAASVRTSIACRSPSARSIVSLCDARRPRAVRQFFLGTDTAPHTHRHQGMRLRLRRRLQRAGRDAGLCPGLRRGGRARPVSKPSPR